MENRQPSSLRELNESLKRARLRTLVPDEWMLVRAWLEAHQQSKQRFAQDVQAAANDADAKNRVREVIENALGVEADIPAAFTVTKNGNAGRPSSASRDTEGPGERRELSHGRRPPEENNGEHPLPRTYTVYGKDGKSGTALRIEIAQGRQTNNGRRPPTINLAIARARNNGRTQEGCDWDGKITVMLTHGEIIQFLAVLLGRLKQVRFAGHGTTHTKWVAIEESERGVRVTIADGDDRRACGIGITDLGQVIAIVSRAWSMVAGTAPLATETVVKRIAEVAADEKKAERVRSDQGGSR